MLFRSVEFKLAESDAADVAQTTWLRLLEHIDRIEFPDRVGSWLAAQRSAGRRVLGYGAASRAVALLCQAHVDRRLLPAVVDASPAKRGLRMPGTDIPVAGPGRLAEDRPDAVLLFVPDLLPEVRDAYPGVEAAGGRWVDVQAMR